MNQQQLKETTRTKIAALWFVLSGVVGVLLGLLSIGGFAITMGQPLVSLVQLVFFLLAGIVFLVLAFYCFKISSLIHCLDREGYETALIFLQTMMLGSLVSAIIGLVIKKQPSSSFILAAIIPNAVIVSLLYSQRDVFAVDSGIRILKRVAIILSLFLLLIPLGLYATFATEKLQSEARKLELKEMEEAWKAKQEAFRQELLEREPTVTSWEKYTNDQFGFELEYPANWNTKVYKVSPRSPEYITIAFTEKGLPENWNPETAYFWISVFPITDELHYEMFQRWMSEIGSPLFNTATLGGESGVDHGGGVAIQRGDYVYDLRLSLVLDENYDYSYSDISKRVWSSFGFVK